MNERTPKELISEAHTIIANNFADPDCIEGRRAIQAINLLRQALAEMSDTTDTARLNWLEDQAIKSPTGISFDHVQKCEDDPSGFRFMRRFHIGEPHRRIRQAIDAEINAAKGIPSY